MANISVVGRIVSDDIELKISANNRPYLIDRGAYDTYGTITSRYSTAARAASRFWCLPAPTWGRRPIPTPR